MSSATPGDFRDGRSRQGGREQNVPLERREGLVGVVAHVRQNPAEHVHGASNRLRIPFTPAFLAMGD